MLAAAGIPGLRTVNGVDGKPREGASPLEMFASAGAGAEPHPVLRGDARPGDSPQRVVGLHGPQRAPGDVIVGFPSIQDHREQHVPDDYRQAHNIMRTKSPEMVRKLHNLFATIRVAEAPISHGYESV